ncbi:hypothetical protein ACJJTC_005110 [Scirpophaga incertulas]
MFKNKLILFSVAVSTKWVNRDNSNGRLTTVMHRFLLHHNAIEIEVEMAKFKFGLDSDFGLDLYLAVPVQVPSKSASAEHRTGASGGVALAGRRSLGLEPTLDLWRLPQFTT